MSAAQKKVIDDHCTNEWSLKVAGPWADFERAGVQKLKSDPAHEVYTDLGRAGRRVAQGGRAAGEDVGRQRQQGAAATRDAILKELKASLAKHKAAY